MVSSRNAAHGCQVLVFLPLVTVLAACSGAGAQKKEPVSCVPMAAVKEVEGTWEGLVKEVRTGRDAGRVVVVLTSHDSYGTYNFAGETARGFLVGTGRVSLQKGRLVSETEQRTVDFTLYLRGSETVLAAHAVGRDEKPYSMELTRMKQPSGH
jgi:hypothetical protein